jgi:hypothetical protein
VVATWSYTIARLVRVFTQPAPESRIRQEPATGGHFVSAGGGSPALFRAGDAVA